MVTGFDLSAASPPPPPLGQLVMPYFELAYVVVLRPVSHELVTFLDFEFRTTFGFSIWLDKKN